MTPPRRIFLVGFMGAGKTTVGRILAGRLGYPFVDVDESIESAAGASVREIFETRGEAAFRDLEAAEIDRCVALDRAVVATGGGTFASDRNRQAIQAAGAAVFLDVPFNVVASRIEGKMAERPLFRDPLQAFRLYSSRLEFYRLADISLAIRAEETGDEIAQRVLLSLPYRGRGGTR